MTNIHRSSEAQGCVYVKHLVVTDESVCSCQEKWSPDQEQIGVCLKRSDTSEDVWLPHVKSSAPPPTTLFNFDQDDHIFNGMITTRRQRAHKGHRSSAGWNRSATADRPSSAIFRSQMCHRPPSCRVNVTLTERGNTRVEKQDAQPGNGTVTNVRFTTEIFHRD